MQKSLEEEPTSVEEVEDTRRRECRTTGQDQVGTTPFPHPIPAHGPKFLPLPSPSPSICRTETVLWFLSPACASSSHLQSQRTQRQKDLVFTPLITQGTHTLSAGHTTYHGLNLQKHFELSF